MTCRPLLLAALCAAPAAAQSNEIPGLDVQLAELGFFVSMQRTGAWPTGTTGAAFETLSCNVGTVDATWEMAMDPDHPFIAFLVVREEDGRMVQISDRSFVKHAFFAQTGNWCGICTLQPFQGGDVLGVGCSDVYTTQNNGDNYWLAPADEIDPWLGTWDPVCSHFDRGEPAVPPPFDCDGARSLTQFQGSVLNDGIGHRVLLDDADLDTSGGAQFWYQGQYVVLGEALANRGDNIGSRGIVPAWNGFDVSFTETDTLLHGSVLQRWTGASVAQASDGTDDGTFVVASKVTGPVDGLYHYEYALQNVDNSRGGGALRIPLCADARVLDVGFHDVDDDAGNDWTHSRTATELVFDAGANALEWNTVYNVWFDSDAAPRAGTVALDHQLPGPGAASVSVAADVPGPLFNVHLGPGCAASDAPDLHATGSPAQATLGNGSFGVESEGHVPVSLAFLLMSTLDGDEDLGAGCHLYLGGLASGQVSSLGVDVSDTSGHTAFPLPIPSSPGLEGAHVNLQVVSFPAGGGPVLGLGELSDGLRVRIGDTLSDCP